MVNYRRNRIANGTYFFTVTLRNRQSNALVREIDALRDAWRTAKARISHEVIAAVVLPDHLHAVIEMRDGLDDYSRLWQDIKKGFTRRVQPSGASTSPWQSRFWEHTIRDVTDLQAHIDYVHINPMKHGLVERVADWPHSSLHRHVSQGLLPADWAGSKSSNGDFGERDDRSMPT